MPAYAPLYEMSTIYQPDYRPAGFTALGMRNIFTVNKNMDFRVEGFLMAPFRELSSNDQQQVVYSDAFPSLHYILSGSFVYTTPIGPLSASLNYYDVQTPVSFYVSIGYIIFNRSAF
jgi:NTE family protein